MPSFTLTDEQELARDHFCSARSLAIQALAGTGKTSTLIALADHLPAKRGVYLAFNDAIANDAAERFPSNVSCKTTHSFAVAHLKKRGYEHERLVTQPNRNHVQAYLAQDNYEIPFGPRPFRSQTISRNTMSSMIMGTLGRFSRSADEEVSWKHVSVPRYLALGDEGKKAFFDKYKSVFDSIWSEISDPHGKSPIGHDLYLKRWTLDRPQFGTDYIMLDEAQDTNDPVVDLLSRQSSQLICVGDSHQQIYAWRGAVDALKKMNCEQKAPLTGSFRFGSAIAEFANSILGGLAGLLRIRGLAKWKDEVVQDFDGHCDAILYGQNRNLIEGLAHHLRQGKEVGIVGGVDEWLRYCEAFDMLEGGIVPAHTELYGFRSYAEVRKYVAEDSELAGVAGQLFLLREEVGSERLKSLLRRTATTKKPQVILSTVYKAKGLEWDTVRIHEDLSGNKLINEAQKRLQYVAATRAKRRLVVSSAFHESATF